VFFLQANGDTGWRSRATLGAGWIPVHCCGMYKLTSKCNTSVAYAWQYLDLQGQVRLHPKDTCSLLRIPLLSGNNPSPAVRKQCPSCNTGAKALPNHSQSNDRPLHVNACRRLLLRPLADCSVLGTARCMTLLLWCAGHDRSHTLHAAAAVAVMQCVTLVVLRLSQACQAVPSKHCVHH
jgi:hypothetical protein